MRISSDETKVFGDYVLVSSKSTRQKFVVDEPKITNGVLRFYAFVKFGELGPLGSASRIRGL